MISPLSFEPAAPLPKSWMGYTCDRVQGGFIVRVCAYCPDKAQADALAASSELRVSHGICQPCYQIQVALIAGAAL